MSEVAIRTEAPPRLLVLTLGLLTAFGPLSIDMYLPGLPAMTRELHASASAGQLTLTASVLGIAFGQALAGPVSDAFGRKLPLLAGVGAFALTSVACALAPSVWVLIAVRLIQGLGGGAGIVIARAIVRDLHGGVVAARLYATLLMITGVGPVAAPLIGGQILTFSTWRGVFVALALIGFALLTLGALVVPETLARGAREHGRISAALRTFGQLLGDLRFAAPAVSYSLSFGALFAYISGASFVLENIYHLSPQLFSVVFAINAGGIVGGSLLSRRVVGRVAPERLFRAGLSVGSVGAVITFAASLAHADIWPVLVGFFITAAAQGLVLPNGMTIAMSTRPDALGSASGLMGLGQFGMGALVAPLVGLAGTHAALPMGVAMLVCGVAAVVLNLTLTRVSAREARARGQSGS